MWVRPVRAREKGLSLLETCISGSIICILTCLVLPPFQNMLRLRQLEGVANELWHDLQFVRANAISLNQNVQFQLQSQAPDFQCYVIHTGSDCVCQRSPQKTVCTSGSRALKTVILTSNHFRLSGTRNRLYWSSSRGTVSPAATLRITHSDGRSIAHVINIAGRIRTCSPEGSVKGIPRC